MAVDLDEALAAGMDAFARPIFVEPAASQPSQPPYSVQKDGVSPLRGVWSSRAVDLAQEEGILVSQVVTLGIRLAEFSLPPQQGDRVVLAGIRFAISDPPRLDGQGGADLTLKSLGPAT